MAMTTAGLKAAIEAEMTSKLGAAEDASTRENFANAIATAIIDYLKANAVPTGSTVTASASGTWPLTAGQLT